MKNALADLIDGGTTMQPAAKPGGGIGTKPAGIQYADRPEPPRTTVEYGEQMDRGPKPTRGLYRGGKRIA